MILLDILYHCFQHSFDNCPGITGDWDLITGRKKEPFHTLASCRAQHRILIFIRELVNMPRIVEKFLLIKLDQTRTGKASGDLLQTPSLRYHDMYSIWLSIQ